MLKAEWSLSDGYFDEHDKWADRADRIEEQVFRQSRAGAILQ